MAQHDGPLFVTLICLVGAVLVVDSGGFAMTQILPEAQIEADRQTVLELTSTFDQAEEAIRSRDLDSLMALYSDRYASRGLKKADVRKIWDELLHNYDLISNVHTFSAIRSVSQDGKAFVEIRCSGALWATNKNSKERIPIDSWHQETHRLLKEKGVWRIVGNTDDATSGRRPPMFGTAPHPLF